MIFRCKSNLDRVNRRIRKKLTVYNITVVKLCKDKFYADRKVRGKDVWLLQNQSI